MSELTTLNEARAKKLTHYFTGKPCKRGHTALRYVSTRQCVECVTRQGNAWKSSNRERHLEARRENRLKNDTPEKRAAAVKRTSAWYQENKTHYNEWRKDWQKKAEREKPVFKIARRLRARLHSVVVKGWKSNTTINLLGCSYEEFLDHLSSQFLDGMSWDNYGEWHIDHIRPCASFDLLDPEQQAQCFHYTNLQPLWAKDNLRKGANY